MKPFTIFAALLFLLAAAVHAYRLYIGGFAVTIAGYSVPLWVSWPVGIIAVILAVMLFIEARPSQ